MSLQSFLSRMWSHVQDLFSDMPSELKTAVHIAVIITENVKAFVDSPAADVLTAIIPGDIDDDIKALLRAKLPAILTELKLADGCAGQTDPLAITACAVKVLQSLDDTVKSSFLHSLSVMIAGVISAGKLAWSDGVYIVEWYYQQYKIAK